MICVFIWNYIVVEKCASEVSDVLRIGITTHTHVYYLIPLLFLCCTLYVLSYVTLDTMAIVSEKAVCTIAL